MYFETIFCDLDGTILDDKWRHYECYKDIISFYGGECISVEDYWRGKRNKESRETLLRKSKFKGTDAQYLKMWIDNIESEQYLAYEKLKPEMEQTLEYLKGCTGKLILITMRKNRKNLERQLKALGIRKYFDKIYCACPGGGQGKSGITVEEQHKKRLVIGDTEDDMDLAKRIGAVFLAVTDGLRDRRYLKTGHYVEKLDIKSICEIFDCL